jgi:hypothetical protein
MRMVLAQHAGRCVGEMTWAPERRATFHFGNAAAEGQTHIVWRRIGIRKIFTRP